MTWLFDRFKLWTAGAAVVLGALAVYFIRKSGGDAERAKQAQADLKAANTVATERAAAKGKSDAALNEEVDRWTRK